MRKGENPWDSKPSASSCGRDGGLAGRTNPQNAGMGIFCRERKVLMPKSSLPLLAHPPFRRAAAWGPIPSRPPAALRLLPPWSIPRAGGWEQLSES